MSSVKLTRGPLCRALGLGGDRACCFLVITASGVGLMFVLILARVLESVPYALQLLM